MRIGSADIPKEKKSKRWDESKEDHSELSYFLCSFTINRSASFFFENRPCDSGAHYNIEYLYNDKSLSLIANLRMTWGEDQYYRSGLKFSLRRFLHFHYSTK